MILEFSGPKRHEQTMERNVTWGETYKLLKKVSKKMDERKKLPGYKVYERRMYVKD